MDAFSEERNLISTSVGGNLADRDVIRVFGGDARNFLQGQLTQDIDDLRPGRCKWSLILSPKGRVEALVRVWGGNSDSEVLLDVDHGCGQVVVDRLNRFRMRVNAEVELLHWQLLRLHGPEAVQLAVTVTAQLRCKRDVASWGCPETEPEDEAVADRIGVVELIGPSIAVPEDLLMVSPELLDGIRIDHGWPNMANEVLGVEPAPLPGELGQRVIDAAVDFEKGCYTGQELVARTHARITNPPRMLTKVRAPQPVPAIGSVFDIDGADAVLTSASPASDSVLAYVRRGGGS